MRRSYHSHSSHSARFWALVGLCFIAGLAINLPLGWLILRQSRPVTVAVNAPRTSARSGATDSAPSEPIRASVPVPITIPVQAVERTEPVEKPVEKRPAPTPDSVVRPEIPRHHAHIRIAQLAYYGNPMAAFEDDLLREHVDLVVPETHFLDHIRSVAPKTPQLLYTNTSSLYFDLLTDWLTYADRKNLSREAAFYHAAKATAFRGDSPSSRPVTWFWRVFRGDDRLSDVTHLVRPQAPSALVFGAKGESVCFGFPDRFREINFNFANGAAGGWSARIEIPTSVDADGKPTQWSTLETKADTTAGLTKSGQIVFDPPADWKPAALGGYFRLYYVRFRTTNAGTAPAARTVLGRDYVSAGGKTEGIVPVFDLSADANGDGYLNDDEYARRAPGKDARFLYESRMPCESYGQMRWAANPSTPEFRTWAVDYHLRMLAKQPKAAGLFMDNSEGKPTVAAAQIRESVANFAQDYGTMLADIDRAIAPRWILANTAGGFAQAEPVIRSNPAYFEEFAIRPLANNYLQFEDLAQLVARRIQLTKPAPYGVIDSLPQRGEPTDERMLLATLAYYYLLADPDSTFLMFYGGHEPSTTWKRHWTAAVARDIGQPSGPWSRFAEGADPSDTRRKYRVYRRDYERAVILYKPLSHADGDWKTQAGLGPDTATTHDLGAAYRPLSADGSVGAPITQIRLRNGEGTILLKGER
jgi:hypothetical protein